MELEAAKLAWECCGANVDDDDEEEDEVDDEEMAARQADAAISLFPADVKLRLRGEGVLDRPCCRRRFGVVDRGGVIDKSRGVPASLRRFGVPGHRMAPIFA